MFSAKLEINKVENDHGILSKVQTMTQATSWVIRKELEDYENDEIEILRLRAGLEKLETICLHREYILLRKFSVTQNTVSTVTCWRNTKQCLGKENHLTGSTGLQELETLVHDFLYT